MKIVILGGGLAGLSTAWHLTQKNISSSIFEKEDRPGGLCRSEKTKEGFLFDYGPHLLFTKDEYVIRLMQDVLKGNLTQKQSAAGQYSFGQTQPEA